MDHKESYIVAIFVIAFALFILLVNPSYTGMVALDECDVTVLSCSDYNETECTEDLCGFSCNWNSTDCIEYIEDISYTIPDLTEKISTVQSLIADTDKVEIIQSLGIDTTTAISTLSGFDLQFQDIDADTTLTDAEKATMITDLEIQVDTFLTDVPQILTITNKISGLPATPVSDITFDMLPPGVTADPEEIYFIQDTVEARTDLAVFSMMTFSEAATQGTYIKKTITAPGQSGFVIEIIPSTVITSQDELNFLGNYDVIKSDPIILSIPISNGAALYSYIITRDVSFLTDLIQTAVIPYEVDIEPTIQVTCGDGKCTELLEDNITCPEDCSKKIPWITIIIILVVIVAIILFIHFFKDKIRGIDVKGLVKRKPKVESLFKSETDKENLKNYISYSINEGVSSEEIKAILLKKGWTKEQVELVLNEIKQPKEQPSKSL